MCSSSQFWPFFYLILLVLFYQQQFLWLENLISVYFCHSGTGSQFHLLSVLWNQSPSSPSLRFMSEIQDFFRFSVSSQDNVSVTFRQPRVHRKSTPPSPKSPTLDMEMKVQSGFCNLNQKLPQVLSPPSWGPFNRTRRPAVNPPTRCLSPVLAISKMQNKCGPDRSRTVTSAVCANSGGSFSPVKLNDPQHKVRLSPSNRMQPTLESEYSSFLQRFLNITHFEWIFRTNARLSTLNLVRTKKSFQNVIF